MPPATCPQPSHSRNLKWAWASSSIPWPWNKGLTGTPKGPLLVCRDALGQPEGRKMLSWPQKWGSSQPQPPEVSLSRVCAGRSKEDASWPRQCQSPRSNHCATLLSPCKATCSPSRWCDCVLGRSLAEGCTVVEEARDLLPCLWLPKPSHTDGAEIPPPPIQFHGCQSTKKSGFSPPPQHSCLCVWL